MTNSRTPRDDENFGLVLCVPGDHVEAAPAFKARQNRGINSDGEYAGRGQECLRLHFVLDQEHHGQRKAQGARRISQHGKRDVYVQPRRLQCRHQRANIAGQQLHQDHANNGDRHGDCADDFHSVVFLGDQSQRGERPYKAQQHFIHAGEWRMAGLIPAVRHRSGVGDEAGPSRERSELDVGHQFR